MRDSGEENISWPALDQLGLAHAGGAHKDEGDRLALGGDAHPSPADGGGDRLHRLVLANNVGLQPLLQLGQPLELLLLDAAGGDVGPQLDDVGQVLLGEGGVGIVLQLRFLLLQPQLQPPLGSLLPVKFNHNCLHPPLS